MVISRLPQGGGSSGEYIFHISTNEPELQSEEVIITNGNTVNKKVKLSGGKATIKTNEGGNYTFICGMAKFEGEYSYFGDYDVTLVLDTAYITIEGKVSLAPPMDSTYQAPEGYDKPNSVDNFTVRVLDTDMSEDEALIDIKSFADGDDTLSFVVDITQHTNVKVEFSSEDGFITPESKYYTLGRKDEKAETITWVEKYAVLEVQREDPELLAEDVYLRWTEGGVPKEIIHHAANLTDKSQFIVKKAGVTYTATCDDISDSVDVTVLNNGIGEPYSIDLSAVGELLPDFPTAYSQWIGTNTNAQTTIDGKTYKVRASSSAAVGMDDYCAPAAFINKIYVYWRSDGKPTTSNPQWLDIQLPSAKTVTSFTHGYNGVGQTASKDFIFQGSEDGVTFKDLISGEFDPNATITNPQIVNVPREKQGKYLFYRWVVTDNRGYFGGTDIYLLKLQGR